MISAYSTSVYGYVSWTWKMWWTLVRGQLVAWNMPFLQIICIISYFVLCINEYKLLAYYHDHIYYFLFVRHHIHPTLVKQIVVEWHIKLSGLNFTKRQHSTKYKVQTTYIILKILHTSYSSTFIAMMYMYTCIEIMYMFTYIQMM